MDKGQLETIFVWIFVALVAVLVFVYGIKMVKNITNLGEDVKTVKFFQDFEKKVNEFYYLDEGSQKTESFWVPSWVESVCFRGTSGSFNPKFDDTTKVFIDLNTGKNVFLVPITNPEIHMKNVELLNNDKNICVKAINGNVDITLINIGGKVNVK